MQERQRELDELFEVQKTGRSGVSTEDEFLMRFRRGPTPQAETPSSHSKIDEDEKQVQIDSSDYNSSDLSQVK